MTNESLVTILSTQLLIEMKEKEQIKNTIVVIARFTIKDQKQNNSHTQKRKYYKICV